MTAQQVLDEWFGELDASGNASEAKRARWFKKDPAFDAHLEKNFRPLIESAVQGQLGWGGSTQELLAEIILLDQFTRNVYRNDPKMYAGDERAIELARRLIETGADRELPTAQRTFVYMPLMHSESLEAQQECVACFERQLQEAPPQAQAALNNNLKYAIAHRDIVQRFGRFPHRNAILGRSTTAEEAEFLQGPGSSF